MLRAEILRRNLKKCYFKYGLHRNLKVSYINKSLEYIVVYINVFIYYIFVLCNKNFHLCGWKIEQCNRLKIKILYTI